MKDKMYKSFNEMEKDLFPEMYKERINNKENKDPKSIINNIMKTF